jgi:putative flippase GtrA
MNSRVQTEFLSRAQALRDSPRAHLVFLRFTTISLASALVDNLTFYLVFHATGTILGAQFAARAVSVFVNYRLVRSLVFFSEHGHRVLLPRYLLLAAVNASIAYAGIRVIAAWTPIGVIPAKIVAESLLFTANFIIQRAFIFTRRPLAGRAAGL